MRESCIFDFIKFSFNNGLIYVFDLASQSCLFVGMFSLTGLPNWYGVVMLPVFDPV